MAYSMYPWHKSQMPDMLKTLSSGTLPMPAHICICITLCLCINFPTSISYIFKAESYLFVFFLYIWFPEVLFLQLVIYNKQEFAVTVLKSCFELLSLNIYMGICFLFIAGIFRRREMWKIMHVCLYWLCWPCVRAVGRLERHLGKGPWCVRQYSVTQRERDYPKE